MTSVHIVLVLAAMVLAIAIPVVVLTRRYTKYERRRARGARNLKPVRKPFWMD